MSFIVTARKWRPLTFKDVIGQEHVTQTLKNAIENNRIHHAYLFSGPRGIGKTTTARILARAINCENLQDSEPCNECMSCISILEGKSLDVIEIDGASNNSVDDVRKLRENAKYAPSTGKYKMYIIDEVHMLSTSAFNALLKILEEPPPHLKFVFATTEPHKVPATILSRCQRHEFKRMELDDIVKQLGFIAEKENIVIDEDSLTAIAKKADGSMRDSQSIFDQVVAFSGNDINYSKLVDALHLIDTEFFFRISKAGLEKDTKEMLKISSEVIDKGYDLIDCLSGLLEHYRNLLTVIVTGDTKLIEASKGTKQLYENEAQYFTKEDLLRILNLIDASEQKIRHSPQPKIKFELSLIQLSTLDSAVELKELINALKDNKTIVQSTKHPVKTKTVNKKESVPVKPRIKEVSKQPANENKEVYKENNQPPVKMVKEDAVQENRTPLDLQSNWTSFIAKYATSKNGLHMLSGSLIKKVDFIGDDVIIYTTNEFTRDNLISKKRNLIRFIHEFSGKNHAVKIIFDEEVNPSRNVGINNKQTQDKSSKIQTDIKSEDLETVEKAIVNLFDAKRIK